MDQPPRLILLLLAVGWTIFRLLRYARLSAGRRAPPPAAAPTATPSPIEPAAAGGGLALRLAAAAVFIAAAALIWSLLFMLPALEDVPPFVRMIAGVLATLYAVQLARGVAARLVAGGRAPAADDNNPIK